ncbi:MULTISPECIES: acyl-CoA thioesterase [Bacillales]|uniref:acyl-CoA thioesterase n=1 Tax=Bacillales TaxID=1385 RepID=UPI00034D3959|nr:MULTISPECIES: acyl-CoA thioesterase [Bacillales]KMZ44663.1 acyl-CoA hydrolase [Bacillus sp. FJAT-27238]MBH0333236.1 acyl-CoA hydrolase [Brevibacillus brevis]NRR03973.1 acyl-CoA thioesterase [Brevibacillus sp. RS1.1]NRS48617.1 acyl-CoA thioesterase [Brevibacillus sp. HB2.2]OUQ89199.1 acyl-CoA thioesterase [Brevibacillus brevis]
MTIQRFVRESRTFKASHVLPPDTNNHNTLFGGRLMAHIDDVASISAMKHARGPVVTASTDSVDFLQPIRVDNEVALEAFVIWTHNTSMEVFVKIVAEDLLTGVRCVCATSFLTFVAIGEDGRPTPVPKIVPETEEEVFLHNGADERAAARKIRRKDNKHLADMLGTRRPWEPLLNTP